MNSKQAEVLALNVLEWMGGNPHILQIFLDHSGSTLATIRDDANNPEFLASVLDFFLMQGDQTICDCCQTLKLNPAEPHQARMVLPGGKDYHWT